MPVKELPSTESIVISPLDSHVKPAHVHGSEVVEPEALQDHSEYEVAIFVAATNPHIGSVGQTGADSPYFSKNDSHFLAVEIVI